LEANKQPDMSYILSAAQAISKHLHRGQLIILESTTYTGTTDETLMEIFVKDGLRLDEDFLLAFSPERVDPGNPEFKIADIPKIVGGCSPLSSKVTAALYGTIVPRVHVVSSARVAETAKLWENTFRLVNIALANEMSMLCDSLGIDTYEVIEAAATKPFGFMPFYPGPGVGGHCIPLDPHYLSWTASKYGYYPRFIMLADQVNSEMAEYIVNLVGDALNDDRVALRGARVLVLGVSYKADVEDVRMSPAIPIIERLRAKGVHVRYHDPVVPRLQVDDAELPPSPRRDLRPVAIERRQAMSDDLSALISEGRRRDDPLESRELTEAELQRADCVLVITAHTSVDYARVAKHAKIVVDSRNVVPRSKDKSGARIISL
ncbi:MAG: nucleotide sugar dehydrogenase, partial [Candidatus Eremiobacteraeota bacterium]|nr:nucleotide sugar dehydrogenase [Candidatus Eremiobacteraeota bacterium]